MSSHHFVREGQEPALFILEAFSLEAVEPLLEWAPLVVVSEIVVDEVVRWGIKIDVVVAKKKNVASLDDQLRDQGPVQFLEYDGDMMASVFEFLIRKKQSGLTIISNSHKDVMNAAQPFGNKLSVSILTSSTRWSYIAVGHFTKWFPINALLLIQANKSVHIASNPELLVSDRIVTKDEGIISLESSEGFWVGESIV